MNKKTLVILAAGLGSRYGGLKQMEAIGANGEIIADYSVFDAMRAGFDNAVFVIKKENEYDFYEKIITPISKHFTVDYVFQELNDIPCSAALPLNRVKPWGTAHAVYAARNKVNETFAVINADDFYGYDAFKKLSLFLAYTSLNNHCMVGYPLINTVTENGSVSRGLCAVEPRTANDEKHDNSEKKQNYLISIEEVLNIYYENGEIYSKDENGEKPLKKAAIVSMNAWGFHKSALLTIENGLAEFLKENIDSKTAEYYLPSAVMRMLKEGHSVYVKKCEDKWYGITYKEDTSLIKAAIAQKTADKLYPEKLWG